MLLQNRLYTCKDLACHSKFPSWERRTPKAGVVLSIPFTQFRLQHLLLCKINGYSRLCLAFTLNYIFDGAGRGSIGKDKGFGVWDLVLSLIGQTELQLLCLFVCLFFMYKTLITGNTYFAYIIFSSPNMCIWRMNQNRTGGAEIPSIWFTRISAVSDILKAFTCIGWMKERIYEQTDQKKNFFF